VYKVRTTPPLSLGHREAQGRIALAGKISTAPQDAHLSELETDIVLAVEGLGPLCRLITTRYDESGGTAQETRTYSVIPGSLSGMDGTNLDPTTFAYGPLASASAPRSPRARSGGAPTTPWAASSSATVRA